MYFSLIFLMALDMTVITGDEKIIFFENICLYVYNKSPQIEQ